MDYSFSIIQIPIRFDTPQTEPAYKLSNGTILFPSEQDSELSFQKGINSALVTTILDHIVVKKGSTKEEIHLDIHLKFGDPTGVVFHRPSSSFCFNRLKNITPQMVTKMI